MKLSTEDGVEIDSPGAEQLAGALARLGLPGNGYAILERSELHYIQTSGSRADGYVVEYREGDEATHRGSKRSDIAHAEMVKVFQAYRRGGDVWKRELEWQPGFARGGSRQRRALDGGSRWMLGLFFLIGCIAISIAGYLAVDTQRFLQRATEVPGTVVRMVRRDSTSAAVVDYRDHSGEPHTLESVWSSSPPAFATGQRVTVLYDPQAADVALHARIRSFGELWGGALFASVFGAMFAGIPALIWITTRGRARRGLAPIDD